MYIYDKQEVKNKITIDDIYQILLDFGGDPMYTDFGIISSTICHNKPGVGSRKLYYYRNNDNDGMFHCYTGCDEPSFDIFELIIRVMNIQTNVIYNLNDAIRWAANRLNIDGTYQEESEVNNLEDWEYLDKYNKIQEIEINEQDLILKEYDKKILDFLNYNIKITPWINEGITPEVMKLFKIGYYPGGAQITIPHFDINNRFIGLRGRSLVEEDASRYGKYRPVKINKIMYNHQIRINLYEINYNKNNIENFKKAIIFESEKSVLKYASYFGQENNIAVACCGSSVSNYQIKLLQSLGVEEIIIAFDRQFKEVNDEEYKHLKKNLIKINNKYSNEVLISIIFDKNKITNYKSAPIDEGPDKFLQLVQERIII